VRLTESRTAERPRPDFEDLARSLHASYLSRWNRHDPAGLERLSRSIAETEPEAGQEKSSAA